jgi:hypothetical protein
MPIFIADQPRAAVDFAGILPPVRYLSLAGFILPALFSILQRDKHTTELSHFQDQIIDPVLQPGIASCASTRGLSAPGRAGFSPWVYR